MRLHLSRYKSRYDSKKDLDVKAYGWDEVVELLSNFKRTKETFEEYCSLDSNDKLAIKDVGYFVGGMFDPPRRKACNLKFRSLLTLDLDHLESWDIDVVISKVKSMGLEFLVHSSHSHSDDSPRLRLVVPFSRDVQPWEYEPIGRRIAEHLGIDFFDDTTYQASRIMFLPSASVDGDVFFEHNKGAWLNPDDILSTYEDPRDFATWPQSSREIEKGGLRERKDKAANPFEIPGIIGAFCRAYPIDEAILEFELPYEESGAGDGRYTYLGGSSADGAVYYPDDGHLFSHHESDPANGNRNAWDLVRLHKFADLDEGVKPDVKIKDMPSQRAMTNLAKSMRPVLEEWEEHTKVVAEDEFEDVVNPDTGVTVEVIGYESLVESISAHEKLTPDAHKEYVLQAAAADLTSTEVAGVAASLADKERTAYPGSTKSNVKGEIEGKRKQLQRRQELDAKDPQKEMLAHFEKKFYKDGEWIKRHGGVFWKYTGTHWKPVDAEIVNSGMLDAISDITSQAETRREETRLRAAFGDKETSSVWNSLRLMYQSIVAGRTARSADNEDDPLGLKRTRMPAAINCDSGTIRFNDKGQFKLSKHNPADLFTSVVPVEFDKKAECPVWDEFCRVSFQNAEDPADLQRHLEEICGYILNVSRRQRCWIMLYGPTRSGKSTVGRLLKEMMGETAKAMDLANYEGGNSHATAGLIGKQALIEDDLASNTLLPDSFIKMNSDEKHVGYNPKGGAEGELVSRAVLVICSNNLPKTRDLSGALAERALVLPFDHTVDPADRDVYLIDKMVEELPGIFNRFVRAFAALQGRGDWKYPVDATKAWENWQGKSNTFLSFLGQCYQEEPGGRVFRPDIWPHYEQWVQEQSIKNGLNKTNFLEAIYQQWGEAEEVRLDDRTGFGWKNYTRVASDPGDRVPDADFDDQEEWDV